MPVFARKLHLGAFDQAADGWLNTDVTPHLLVARLGVLPWLLRRLGVVGEQRFAGYQSGAFRSLRYLDVARRFRFDDATFDCVYASHLLEHLHPDVAEQCLREIHRVLRPGGCVRLAVPDLDQVVADYDPDDPDRFLWGIYQGRGRRAKRTARHWWHYNESSLSALLSAVGFREAHRCEFREGRCPDLQLVESRRWSLFMEALR
ncbi:MAG: class I SAM-dependent methyltransferase [Solirubrobacteraceae bacterium]